MKNVVTIVTSFYVLFVMFFWIIRGLVDINLDVDIEELLGILILVPLFIVLLRVLSRATRIIRFGYLKDVKSVEVSHPLDGHLVNVRNEGSSKLKIYLVEVIVVTLYFSLFMSLFWIFGDGYPYDLMSIPTSFLSSSFILILVMIYNLINAKKEKLEFNSI